jgi:MFS family permease
MTRSKHQLYLAVSAAAVSSLGSAMLSFALSLYLLAKTGSSLSFALSVIIQPLISLVLMPIVGPIVDRYAKKVVIAISQSASMVALAGFGWYLQTTASHLLVAAVCLLVVLRASDLY